MEIYLIRHGKTKGNLEKRYVGRTDEALLEESCRQLKRIGGMLGDVQLVYTSRMKRCRQTAQILFPKQTILIWNGLEETDFGDFEYRTYHELKDLQAYRSWIDSMGLGDIPHGESGSDFRVRCQNSFLECLRDAAERKLSRIGIVAHGGTIMSVMEKFSAQQKDFYFWQAANGGGYLAVWDENVKDVRLQVKMKLE